MTTVVINAIVFNILSYKMFEGCRTGLWAALRNKNKQEMSTSNAVCTRDYCSAWDESTLTVFISSQQSENAGFHGKPLFAWPTKVNWHMLHS